MARGTCSQDDALELSPPPQAESSGREPPCRHPCLAMLPTACLAGIVAGFLVGAGDVLYSWERLDRFLPRCGGKLVCAIHVGALYAAAGAVAALLVAIALLGLVNLTRLGPLAGHCLLQHRVTREHNCRDAMAGLSLVLAGVPLLALALGATYLYGVRILATRHHQGLIVLVVMATTLVALAGTVLAAFVLGRLVEVLLRAVARGRVARVLSHPVAPLATVAFFLAGGAGAAAVAWRATLGQLDLRPHVSGALVLILTLPAFYLVRRAAARCSAVAVRCASFKWLRALPRIPRLLLRAILVMVLLLATIFLSGRSDAVRKAAAAGSGLGGVLATTLRRLIDLDRDGYSAVLGGGDCNDFDRSVHPRAIDIPDDGVDQNCLGGDVELGSQAGDTGFVPLPATVPANANIMLVTVDTVRADHLGCYDYHRPTSPAMDALASEGTLFVHAWAHAPSTRYCMPAIATGRYPSQVLWDTSVWWPGLRPENRTIAEVLKDRGFTTGAIFNYHYFDRVRRFDQGFDEYDNENARLHQGRDPASTRGSSSVEQARKAIRFLERHAQERFFLWVHFYDPHFQYERH
ncbi:MAG: sulfatase-like hydrolase/transferase, partial [Pseudomonadota bacterium]